MQPGFGQVLVFALADDCSAMRYAIRNTDVKNRNGLFSSPGFVVLFSLVLVVLPADSAFAWGPGVHMVTGNWLLQNLAALPPVVAGPIMQFPGQFLYGSLCPDVFLGKGSVTHRGHSHTWQKGLTLLRLADTTPRVAFAYGYLAHLAADTVAHNVFVPQSAAMAPGAGRLAHVYMEMQADNVLPWDSSDALSVFDEPVSRASSALLRKAMRQPAWSFWAKANLFKGSIALGGATTWRASMGFLNKAILPDAENDFCSAFVQKMLTVSTRAVASLLCDIKGSPVRCLDPVGTEALFGLKGREINLSLLAATLGGIASNTVQSLFTKNRIAGYIGTSPGNLPDQQLPDAPVTKELLLTGSDSRNPQHCDYVVTLPDALLSLPPVCVPEDPGRG